MTSTNHLGITLVEQSQAQKEITVNTAFTRLDAFLNNGAKSKSANTPPSSPASGDLYIVGGSPAGAWSGNAHAIAYYDQAWQFIMPNTGLTLWVADENLLYSYNGTSWVAALGITGTAPSNGQVPVYNGSQWVPGNVVTSDNRIINGDMRIDQRNEGASLSLTTDAYTIDRWLGRLNGTLRYSVQQSTDAPAGFTNSLKFTIGTAEASLGAGDYCCIEQRIEGFNVADFNMGTANASGFAVDFWVKTSLAGTYAISLANSAFNRAYVSPFVISTANTWQHIAVVVPGDTSGTWLSTNGTGMRITIAMAAGTTYQTSTTNAWQGSGIFNSSACANLAATNGNTFQLTGVRLQAGNMVLPYTPRSYGHSLMLCQRYYEKTFSPGTKAAQSAGTTDAIAVVGNAASTFGCSMEFHVTKRAAPTIVSYNPSSANANWRDTTNNADRTATIGTIGQNSFLITGASGAVGATNIIHFSADCEL